MNAIVLQHNLRDESTGETDISGVPLRTRCGEIE
jgi:hypothetical protein